MPLAILAIAAVFASGVFAAPVSAEQLDPAATTWQIQLQGKVDTSVPADVYDIDGFSTPATRGQRRV